MSKCVGIYGISFGIEIGGEGAVAITAGSDLTGKSKLVDKCPSLLIAELSLRLQN